MKVFLTIFTYGGLARHTFEAFAVEMRLSSGVEWKIEWPPEDALISRSRSVMASRALKSGCDVWVQIDHDIGWRPGEVAGLAAKARETMGIVGGLYTFKQPKLHFPWRPAGAAREGVLTIGEDKLLEADVVSTGFMATSIPAMAEACEQLVGHEDPDLSVHWCDFGAGTDHTWPDLFRCVARPPRPGAKAWDYLSEDWAFCWRLKAMGVPVHAWTKALLTHYGVFGWNVMTTTQERPG